MERPPPEIGMISKHRWTAGLVFILKLLNKTLGFRLNPCFAFEGTRVQNKSKAYWSKSSTWFPGRTVGALIDHRESPIGPPAERLFGAAASALFQRGMPADDRSNVEVCGATQGLDYSTDEDVDRTSFLTKIDRGLTSVGYTYAILILDLSRFHFVNVEYGTYVGDALLRRIELRLRGAITGHTLAATLVGDKFAVSSSVRLTVSEADRIALRLLDTIRLPLEVEGTSFVVGATIGIALTPGGRSRSALLDQAWVAVRWGKVCGQGDIHFFNRAMAEPVREREGLKHDLGSAIQQHEFVLFYEPVFDLMGWNIDGFEVSLSWRHRTRGIIQASEFMPLAEELGCATTVLSWMLRKVLAEAVNLADGTQLAVKIPSSKLGYTDIACNIADTLRDAGSDAARLELEFSLPLLKDSHKGPQRVLHSLRDQSRVRLTLAGFGVGYACFDEIGNINPDKVKIDKSLVRDLCSRSGRSRVAAIVAHATKLGIATVAEGVDTWSQAKILASFGCMQGQGRFFGSLVTAAVVPSLLRRERL